MYLLLVLIHNLILDTDNYYQLILSHIIVCLSSYFWNLKIEVHFMLKLTTQKEKANKRFLKSLLCDIIEIDRRNEFNLEIS